MTKILGFYVEGLNSTGVFEGYVRSEANDYKVDFNTCEMKLDGSLLSKECHHVFLSEGIRYLDFEIFEKIFNLKFSFNAFTQIIDLISKDSAFPVVLKETLLNKKITGSAKDDVGKDKKEIVKTPYENIDGVNLYQRLSYVTSQDRNSTVDQNNTVHDLYLNAELMKMTSELSISGANGIYKLPWVSLRRRDPEGKLGGSLGLSNIELGNINAPNTQFLTTSGKLTGIIFSNKQLELSTNSNFQNFQGELKRGWFLELYQNDILIRSMDSNENQRYEFQQVNLILGPNRFHLIFYGPHGEVEHSYITYNLSSEFISQRNYEYTGSVAVNDSGMQDSMITINTRIHKQLLTTLSLKNDDRLRSQMDLKGFFRNTIYTATIAQSDQGEVYGLESSFLLGDYTMNANYYSYDGYLTYGTKASNELDEQASFNVFFPFFNFFQIQQSYRQSKLVNSSDKTQEYVNRLAFPIFSLYLAHEAIWDKDNFTGDFFTRLNFFGFLHRISAKYNKNFRWKDLSLESNFSSSSYTYSFLVERKLTEKFTDFSLAIQKTFKHFFLFLSSSLNDYGDKSLTLGLGNLLSTSIKTGHYSFSPPIQKEMGQILIIAFEDSNHNGVKEESEAIVSDLKIRENYNSRIFITDHKGEVFIDQLPAWQDVKLDYFSDSLTNIYLTTFKDTETFFIRPGKTMRHFLPMRTLGEMYGTIITSEKSKVLLKNLMLKLYLQDTLIKEIIPEDDGYYYVGKVFLAKYKMVVFDKEKNSVISEKEIVLLNPNDPVVETDFIL